MMNSVIIVAAGSGKRMNAGINKQYIKLKDKEIIAYTIEAFYKNKNIDEIIVCIKKEEEMFFKEHIIDKYGFENIKISYGGKERQDSIYNSLDKLSDDCDIVLVHDGARPFIDIDTIDRSIDMANQKDAIIVGVPVKDTIKVVSDKFIDSTPSRDALWMAQTPQAFKYDIIIKAYKDAYDNGYYGTDDSSLVEKIGYKVFMVEGSYNNIKITSPEDLVFGDSILNIRSKGE